MSSVRAILAAAMIAALAGCSSPPPPAQPQTQAQASAPAAAPAPSVPATDPAALPPIPDVPFPPARPMPVVEAVFRFAAEHPEVLSKMPCFCGCENRGHKHNDDCFVAARDERGRVTAWEPHGIG
jgi:hypothetical protein